MPHLSPLHSLRAALVLAAGLLALQVAYADSGPMLPRNTPPTYTQECASCHAAYPPGMLPARSWQRVMEGLDQHYGSDASLDKTSVEQLSQWLRANAGTYKRVAEEPPQNRITRSAWFERKHRKVDPAVWQHASVKSASNCAACHTGTEQGIYNDDNLKFPAGLDARYRKAWND